MSEPIFVELDEVLVLHRMSISRFGGSDGLRDEHRIAAAVEQPKNTYFYGRGDFFDVAAAYAFHISQAQAFLDGNKRTAMAAALAFLDRNGVAVTFDWAKLYDGMIGFAEKRMGKSEFAADLRDQARILGWRGD